MSSPGSKSGARSTAKRGLLLVRLGLGLAVIGIGCFLLSYPQVASPAVAHSNSPSLPLLAWSGILAWIAGMLLALAGRASIRRLARESRREAAVEDGGPRTGGQ